MIEVVSDVCVVNVYVYVIDVAVVVFDVVVDVDVNDDVVVVSE